MLASCKDSLLQALGTLTCHQAGIEALENCSRQNQLTLVNALLRPYENRAWGQNNWLLMRFWLGNGYAFRDSRSPCIWQSAGEQRKSLGLPRSRGKNGLHTGLLHHIAPAYPSECFHVNKNLKDLEMFLNFLFFFFFKYRNLLHLFFWITSN